VTVTCMLDVVGVAVEPEVHGKLGINGDAQRLESVRNISKTKLLSTCLNNLFSV